MENWIMMLTNKVKKIMSKQTEHDGRFDAIDTALANASVQGVLDKIGATADTGGSATAGTLMAKNNAILNAMSKVAGVTAQTKKFTEFEVGSVGKNGNKLITGSGRCLIASINGKVSVDGKTAIDLPDTEWHEVYFEESIQLFGGTSSTSDKLRYIVQT